MLDKHLIINTTPKANEKNIVYKDDYRITVLTDELFRIEKNSERKYCDKATQVIFNRALDQVNIKVEDKASELIITTSKLSLCIKSELLESEVIFLDGRRIKLKDEQNLLGTYRTLDACEGDEFLSYDSNSQKRTKISLEKGVVSKNGVAVLDDSNSLIIDEDGMVKAREIKEQDIYVFAYDKNYREAIKALYLVTGSIPLIPRFALGNWWSRYHAYTQEEYLELMESFAEDKLPFTVATVDMDWHPSMNMPEGIDGWTGYTWNTDLFPDYKAFLNKLHEMGLHTTLNLHPATGVQRHEAAYEEMGKALGVDTSDGKKIDFDITDEAFINEYFKILHKPYEKDGVDFWWIDWQQGCNTKIEGLDPLWALNHFHTLDIAKEKNPLILSRYCGIGSHRYPVGFSGDTVVTWKSLDYLPYFTANATNAGYSWWSHDIGGHMWGIKDNELYVRFLQFGVFSPINRLHSSNSNTFSKMPEVFTGGAGEIAKRYLRFRQALLPFIYSCMLENTKNGLALIEPMYYEYPDCEEAYEYKNEYLFGRELLVAPITKHSEEMGVSSVKVWFPEGTWTDIFTGTKYVGPCTKEVYRYLDHIPVFAKEGGILALDYNDDKNSLELPCTLRLLISNGNGATCLYEDENMEDVLTNISFNCIHDNKYELIITPQDTSDKLKDREYFIEMINMRNADITFEGEYNVSKDHKNRYVRFKLSGLNNNGENRFIIEDKTDSRQKFNEDLTYLISLLEFDNNLKDKLNDELLKQDDLKQKMNIINDFDILPLYKNMLLELF